jgi:hypothetical protein
VVAAHTDTVVYMGDLVSLLMTLVVISVVSLVLVLALFGAGVALCWRGLRRRIRVAANIRSKAPTIWLVPTSEAARLHRRLRRLTGSARAAGHLGGNAMEPLVLELEGHAVALEQTLLSMPGRDPVSKAHRRAAARELARLERVVDDLGRMALGHSTGPGYLPLRPLDRLEEQVQALAAANAELNAMESGPQGPAPAPSAQPDYHGSRSATTAASTPR